MKALPYAAVAAAPLFIAAGVITIAAPAPSPGHVAPVRLIAVQENVVPIARRQQPPNGGQSATGSLVTFASSRPIAGHGEARSQVSNLSVAGGLVRAVAVSAYCRNGAAQSHVIGLRALTPAGALTADVRRRNLDGSTTVVGLRLRLPASGSRPAVTIDVAVATCAAEPDRPPVILPDLPASVHEALLRKANAGSPAPVASTVLITASARVDDGC
ncbi:hypothetical protein [Paractinoplanes globisporus]|uniref:Uncharacterized protein n=1 Tax=Paractinoplanes globisporus TaxID=113565 RepID=A0ABW6WEV7_9ACTN|nr:hypothetical protein [Actinoplanes globisporus]